MSSIDFLSSTEIKFLPPKLEYWVKTIITDNPIPPHKLDATKEIPVDNVILEQKIVVSGLPVHDRNSLRDQYRLFGKYMPTAICEQWMQREIEGLLASSFDSRFVKQEVYLKLGEHAKPLVVEMLRRSVEKYGFEGLKHVAIVSADCNGLRTFNFNAGHTKGDILLNRVAETMMRLSEIKQFGIIKIVPCIRGGDEFGFIMEAEQPITPETLKEILSLIKNEVSKIQLHDILNFRDEETLARKCKMSVEEWRLLTKEEQNELIKKEKIRQDFVMPCTVGVGGAIAYDGVKAAANDRREGKELLPTDDRLTATWKIVGGTWEVADKLCDLDKDAYKQSLRDSDDPDDQFHIQLMSRNEEVVMLEAERYRTRKALKVIFDEALKVDAEQAGYKELVQKILALKDAMENNTI